jgi:hypothetical protein
MWSSIAFLGLGMVATVAAHGHVTGIVAGGIL